VKVEVDEGLLRDVTMALCYVVEIGDKRFSLRLYRELAERLVRVLGSRVELNAD